MRWRYRRGVQRATDAERSYVVHGEISTGGMATVHYGRATTKSGFGKVVAIKRLHRHLAKDPSFLALFLDEARLAVRIQHANVVGIVDVVSHDGEVLLVMDYVHGEPLSSLLARTRENGDVVDVAIVASVMGGALQGLDAAHVAKSETGEPLHIVHRDVSPQNLIVGVDGVTRVLDFGVARAAVQQHLTRTGEVRGKLAYMAPEQIEGKPVDRRSDIYAAGVVLWEMLTGRRLFAGDNDGAILAQVLQNAIPKPSTLVPTVPAGFDRIALTALARNPAERFSTARAMASAIESLGIAAGTVAVGDWVQDLAGDRLARRAEIVAHIEAQTTATGTAGASTDEADAPPPILSVDDETVTTDVRFASEPPRPARRPASKRAWLVGLAAVMAAAVLGTVGVAAVRPRAPEPKAGSFAPPGAASDEPGVASAPQPSAQASNDAVDKENAPPHVPGASPAARGGVSGPSRVGASMPNTSRPPTSTGRGARTAPSAPKPSVDCHPPYTMVGGVKVPKPECPLD
jgi:serine/threonine-protein kinase